MSKLILPKVIRIEPASACNLRCVHCPTGTIPMARVLMTEELFANVLRQLCALDVNVFVLYHGGEPFLNKHIFDFIKSLRSQHKSAHIKLVTNGMMLDKSKLDSIAQSSLDLIEFSLDGASAVESETIRRGSQTEVVLRNIKLLLQLREQHRSKLKIVVSTTQFIQQASQDSILPVQSPPEIPSWLLEEIPNIDEFKSHWAMAWPRMEVGNGLSVVEYDDESFAEEYRDSCDHLNSTMTIRADGSVVPCCYDLLSDLTMGNAINEPLIDIWNSTSYHHLRQSIATMNPPATCANCNVIRKRKRYLIQG